MSDLAHHQTEEVQLIFPGMGKSDIMHTDHIGSAYPNKIICPCPSPLPPMYTNSSCS